MVYLLYAIFFLSCLALVAAVLLQPGKTDAGALFTSNVSSSALAPRGTATVLSKITIVAATTFMLSALLLAMPALTGNVSVLSSNPEAPAESNTSSDSNANANTAAPNATDNTAGDNSNSALIETPATDEAAKKAANAAAANSAPTNAAISPVGNSKAPTANAAPAKNGANAKK